MDKAEVKKMLLDLQSELTSIIPHLGLPQKKQRLLEIEEQMQSPVFWQDNEQATKISQDYGSLKKFVDLWESLEAKVSNLLKSGEAVDAKQVADLQKDFAQHKLVAFFTGKYDDHNALLAIHAGAGGTDAQDWTEMLLRMYTRYGEKHGFLVTIQELQRGSEAGIKSVLLELTGQYAYGYLRPEAGVHRLVRLSPFNPTHTRETSFALVEVLPVIDNENEVTLDPKEVEIEVTTSSGHGGQSVNTTYSAVRLLHKPTGIRVSIQNERSQHQNKELAFKVLRARLKQFQDQQASEHKRELRGEFKSAEWGNQIRSYVLHPYQLVKDHRTNYETSDTQAVLDGEIDSFITAVLEKKAL